MSETKFTDQRPRTTRAELPEWAKAKAPLPKDETLAVFIDKLRHEFRERVRAYKEAHPESERE